MQQVFHEIKINTNGQGFYDFTKKTLSWLTSQKIKNGMLNINKKLMLGTWQGLYLFEHRIQKHTRTLMHHLIGE